MTLLMKSLLVATIATSGIAANAQSNECSVQINKLGNEYQALNQEYMKTLYFTELMAEINSDARTAAWSYTALAGASTAAFGVGVFGAALSTGSTASVVGNSAVAKTISKTVNAVVYNLFMRPIMALAGSQAGFFIVTAGPVAYTVGVSGIEIVTKNKPTIKVDFSDESTLSKAILYPLIAAIDNAEKAQFEKVVSPTNLDRLRDGVTFGHYEKNQIAKLVETSKAKAKAIEALQKVIASETTQQLAQCK